VNVCAPTAFVILSQESIGVTSWWQGPVGPSPCTVWNRVPISSFPIVIRDSRSICNLICVIVYLIYHFNVIPEFNPEDVGMIFHNTGLQHLLSLLSQRSWSSFKLVSAWPLLLAVINKIVDAYGVKCKCILVDFVLVAKRGNFPMVFSLEQAARKSAN
jgi:hypothetical protein